MNQALLVLRLYATQDRHLHCRGLESESRDKHQKPQEEVARPFFVCFWLKSKVLCESEEVIHARDVRVCGRADI